MIKTIRSQNKEYATNEILTLKAPEWAKRASSLIYPERMSEWERVVKMRAGEKENGAELEMALGAMELLDKGVDFEKVEKYIEDKSTSASGASMAENIVLNFSKRGPDFFQSIRPNDAIDLVAQLRDINARLAERHKNDHSKENKAVNPKEELVALATQKRSLETELQRLETQLSAAKEQEDKAKGKGIGEE